MENVTPSAVVCERRSSSRPEAPVSGGGSDRSRSTAARALPAREARQSSDSPRPPLGTGITPRQEVEGGGGIMAVAWRPLVVEETNSTPRKLFPPMVSRVHFSDAHSSDLSLCHLDDNNRARADDGFLPRANGRALALQRKSQRGGGRDAAGPPRVLDAQWHSQDPLSGVAPFSEHTLPPRHARL